MQATISATRAVAVELGRRLYLPVFIVCIVVSALLLGLSIWLVTQSAWWVLLLVVVCLWVGIAAGTLSVGWLLMKYVRPTQTAPQRVLVKAFADKLQRLADTVGTPKFIMLFRILRDVAVPRQNSYIASLSDDSLTLRNDFMEIVDSYK